MEPAAHAVDVGKGCARSRYETLDTSVVCSNQYLPFAQIEAKEQAAIAPPRPTYEELEVVIRSLKAENRALRDGFIPSEDPQYDEVLADNQSLREHNDALQAAWEASEDTLRRVRDKLESQNNELWKIVSDSTVP